MSLPVTALNGRADQIHNLEWGHTVFKSIYDIDEAYLIIRIATGRKYYVKGIAEELLTRRELTVLLLSNHLSIEEIALAYESLKNNATDNEIIFNIVTAEFVCTNRHY